MALVSFKFWKLQNKPFSKIAKDYIFCLISESQPNLVTLRPLFSHFSLASFSKFYKNRRAQEKAHFSFLFEDGLAYIKCVIYSCFPNAEKGKKQKTSKDQKIHRRLSNAESNTFLNSQFFIPEKVSRKQCCKTNIRCNL